MKPKVFDLTLASLRTMRSDKLVAMRGAVEKALSEKRAEIERNLSQIDELIPKVRGGSGAAATAGGTLH